MDTNSKDSEPPETMESVINVENASCTFGNENLVTSQKPAAEVTPTPCTPDNFKSPLDFSTVTVEQLGITSESFVNNSSGKSSSCLKKSRRRSTIGVRGSPETNNLIRFIAEKRNLKNAERSPLTQNFTFPGSPVLCRNVNSLRERISAFQSAFHSIKEKEKSTDCPEFSEAEGVFHTAGLPKKESLGECQQSAFPAQLPKRRRISSQGNSGENLTQAVGPQMFNVATPPCTARGCTIETSLVGLSEKCSEPGLTQSGCLAEESIPLSELTETSAGIKIAYRAEDRGSGDAASPDKLAEVGTGTAPEVGPLVTPLCRGDFPPPETSALRSVLKRPAVKLCLESLQEHCDNLCDDGTHPSLISTLANYCKEQQAEAQENYKVQAFVNMRKRKRVTFGEDLSPEVFDESLPANTPLRRGETPARKQDLSAISPLPLKQSPVPEQLPQPNFDDKGENLENIEPLQVSFAVASPLSKSSISENLSGTGTSANNHEKTPPCKDGRRTRSSNRRSQLISLAEDSVCSLYSIEAQPCKEKKIKRRKSQESKRTDRVLPKKNPVLKSGPKKRGRRKKGVEKSLYGERDIASKKPLLSPIPELPEVSEMSPSAPSIHRMFSDDFNSNGELEETKPPERKNLLPQYSDLQMNQEFNKYDVSEFCSSYIKSSLLLTNASFDQDSTVNTVGIRTKKIIPKAEIKSERENGLKSGTENENSHGSCASVNEKPVVSDGPQSAFIMQSQEFSTASQNVENRFQSFEIPGERKSEQQDDFLVATEGKLQTKHLLFGSEKECDYSDDVLIDSKKQKKSQNENLRRKSAASSSGVSSEGKPRRRRSMCHPDGQSLHLDTDGIHKPSYSVGRSVEISLENSELYKDLSDTIEQTFQRTNQELKVRRSTRLQKDLENEGLVWISLPLPSTSCPSQQTKRRTLHAFDRRGLESTSPRINAVSFRPKPCPLYSTSDQENSQGLAANFFSLSGKRRKSFCTSALVNTENTKSKC